jgi:hypothetical protein
MDLTPVNSVSSVSILLPEISHALQSQLDFVRILIAIRRHPSYLNGTADGNGALNDAASP